MPESYLSLISVLLITLGSICPLKLALILSESYLGLISVLHPLDQSIDNARVEKCPPLWAGPMFQNSAHNFAFPCDPPRGRHMVTLFTLRYVRILFSVVVKSSRLSSLLRLSLQSLLLRHNVAIRTAKVEREGPFATARRYSDSAHRNDGSCDFGGLNREIVLQSVLLETVLSTK